MEAPPEGSTLGQLVEEQFNESYLVDYFCEVCKKQSRQVRKLWTSASSIRRVCHVPVDSMRAWLHTIFYPWSLLSKKVKMARMLLLL